MTSSNRSLISKFDGSFRKADVVLAEVVGVGLTVDVAPDPIREVGVDVQLVQLEPGAIERP